MGVDRHYQYPGEVSHDNFAFGKKTEPNKAEDNKVYTKEEQERAKELYKKTHHDYDPGEQKNRGYNWSFDQNQHVFGKGN